MKTRLNIYFDPVLIDRLGRFAARQRLSRSAVVEAALASFLSPDGADRREAAIARRLDHLSRQVARLERDTTVAVESLALFVHHWLTLTPPVSEARLAVARALGAKRYQDFVDGLVQRLAQGRSLIREVSEELYQNAAAPASAPAEGAEHGEAGDGERP